MSNLEFPGNASADGPPNFRWCGIDKLRNELQVLAIQEVVAHQGEFQVRAWLPSKVEVQRVVAGNVETRQFVDVANAEVLLEMFGQVDGRLHEELMAWVLSIGVITCRVLAILVFTNVHLQVAVRTHELPFRKNLPLHERFYPVGSATHFVAGRSE